MTGEDRYFTRFIRSTEDYTLPERFTFPFYYQPHPLCELAAIELQDYLETQNEWQHNFGITGDKETAIGKMFGVLLVKNKFGDIGYLSAFSGKLADSNHHDKFVPPVFDMLVEGEFFILGQSEINTITEQIESIQQDLRFLSATTDLRTTSDAAATEIQALRKAMINTRKNRKTQRIAAELTLNPEEASRLSQQLNNESIKEKTALKKLTTDWNQRIQEKQHALKFFSDKIDALKERRKLLSSTLQSRLFNQYSFLNSSGTNKNLNDIFKETSRIMPPAGAGECAAPKLLQHAFKSDMQPLAMAEFWWGASPKSAVRKHLHYYPACQGKCQPILEHMLDDIKMDENPLLINPAMGKSIDTIYEDEAILVINKPTEFLSTPGKNIKDSVFARVKNRYPTATGPLIVHRLDMSTSGLMLIALSKSAHKSLQKQFIRRSVKKRYIAMLDGLIRQNSGTIDLPLRVDIDDRPRQLVCHEHGKRSSTKWQVLQRFQDKTKIAFYPITGRTHQLRIHSAHKAGLNAPIIGDDLYGQRADRLYLHAEYLEFTHPTNHERMKFRADAEF